MDSIHPLRSFRENQNPPMSQRRLAEILGVDRVTVTRWETGMRRIDPELLPKIVELTGINPITIRPDLAELMRPKELAP